MIVLGLAGSAGAGKDTIAAYLAKRYGFISLSWADPLREEVREAFDLPDYSLLLDREAKDKATGRMALRYCKDLAFTELATLEMDRQNRAVGEELYTTPQHVPLSPRQVLMWWGTEYRHSQDPNYWVHRTAIRIAAIQHQVNYPEQAPQFFVIPDTRFPNEQTYIHENDGNIWHVRRDAVVEQNAHISAVPLAVMEGEREIWNNDSITRLHYGVDLMLATSARFVRVEPMEIISGTCEPDAPGVLGAITPQESYEDNKAVFGPSAEVTQ